MAVLGLRRLRVFRMTAGHSHIYRRVVYLLVIRTLSERNTWITSSKCLTYGEMHSLTSSCALVLLNVLLTPMLINSFIANEYESEGNVQSW